MSEGNNLVWKQQTSVLGQKAYLSHINKFTHTHTHTQKKK